MVTPRRGDEQRKELRARNSIFSRLPGLAGRESAPRGRHNATLHSRPSDAGFPINQELR